MLSIPTILWYKQAGNAEGVTLCQGLPDCGWNGRVKNVSLPVTAAEIEVEMQP